MIHIDNDWDEVLADTLRGDAYQRICYGLKEEYAAETIYPPAEDILNALRYTPYGAVKAVVLGQDPYHGPGQAHGLCFSVQKGMKIPPSLRNIFQEIEQDLGYPPPPDGTLTKWAGQGVLMLNTVLTVRRGQANSHKNLGWTAFTDTMISKLSARETPIVFLLWGGHARAKKTLITSPRHLILETVHPSPLSAYGGFFGCRHFSRCNAFLQENGIAPIDWNLNTP